MDHERLRAAVGAGRLEWRRHALERLAERAIPQAIVLEVLWSGECIEEYRTDKPFPSALFLGWHAGSPIHVVVALDESTNSAHIVTTYEPDLEHFEPDFRTRRQQ